MTVKLHKVTIFAVSTGTIDYEELDQLKEYCDQNGPCISSVETVEFDREWCDDDPLNQLSNLGNRAFLDTQMKKDG